MNTDIENVRVDAHGGHTSRMTFSLHWEQPDARYHVWCDEDHKPGDEIYKNPPLGTERLIMGMLNPAHFDTRRLKSDAKANAAMLAEAKRIANRDGLWQAALDRVAAAARGKNVDMIRRALRARVAAHAMELREALRGLLVDVEDGRQPLGTLDIALAALASTEPEIGEIAKWVELYGQETVDTAIANPEASDVHQE